MNLISKYNVPVPRYTSYPTVPAWDSTPSQEEWKQLVRESFIKTNSDKGISLYIHLPFCESLCTYCACNTRITVNHKVEGPYIDAVLKEWKLYLNLFDQKPRIKELHLGGGTPTFFSPENLRRLINGILAPAGRCDFFDFSFEGHPANTGTAHLQVLYDLGFRRVSFGIQDFDPKVQDVINRYQSFEQVDQVVGEARRIGYTSVNFDLVYGLPFQSLNSIIDTIQQVNRLRPDRIAFYSYAHVPWMRPGQRKFSEKDLPLDIEKRALYEKGRELFTEAGYEDVGMDHFALKHDALFQAALKKSLHRNFMGYTEHHTELMVSLGVSAISDTWNSFSQNIKAVEPYQEAVHSGLFPITKGHKSSSDDLKLRKIILDIMCKGEAKWSEEERFNPLLSQAIQRCQALEEDGLIQLNRFGLKVTETGRAFLRNICACFDVYLQIPKTEQKFSTAV